MAGVRLPGARRGRSRIEDLQVEIPGLPEPVAELPENNGVSGMILLQYSD